MADEMKIPPEVREEHQRGAALLQQFKNRLIFQITRRLEAHPLADQGLLERLGANHFGYMGIEGSGPSAVNAWLYDTRRSSDELVRFAGIIGMDIVEITPDRQPV